MSFLSKKSIPFLRSFLISQFVIGLFACFSITAQAVSVDVTGEVAPLPSQLIVNIEASKTSVHQDESIAYTVTYSTTSTSPIPITIEAEWSLATVSGSNGSQFSIVDYELGSGSQGFGNTSPVYDPTQRTLSWYIPSFSQADGEQTVTFSLKTNSSYQQSSTATFSTSAVLLSTTSSLQSVVNHSYTYVPPTTTSSPTPTPTATPTTTPATSTPTSAPAASPNAVLTASPSPVTNTGTGTTPRSPFQILSVNARQQSQTQATFHIRVSHPDQLVIRYGTDQKNLTNNVVLTGKATDHFLTLDQLQTETQYYFTIEPTLSSYIRNFTPRLVGFRTAKPQPDTSPPASSPAPSLDDTNDIPINALPDKFTIVSHYGNILNTAYRTVQTQNSLGFSRGTLEYNFTLPDTQHSDQVSVAFGKLSTYPAIKPQSTLLPLESEFAAQYLPSRAWSARVSVPADPGTYMVILRRQNAYGSLGEEIIGLLTVTTPLIVQNSKEQPLENVHMDLERYNEDTQLYEPIMPSYFAPKRGFSSDSTGSFFFPPLTGQYRATFSDKYYLTQSLDFTVDNQATQLPVVTLENRKIGFFEWLMSLLQRLVMWLGRRVGLGLEEV